MTCLLLDMRFLLELVSCWHQIANAHRNAAACARCPVCALFINTGTLRKNERFAVRGALRTRWGRAGAAARAHGGRPGRHSGFMAIIRSGVCVNAHSPAEYLPSFDS